jgi:aspartate/methionine/tyrosine aminotransferase
VAEVSQRVEAIAPFYVMELLARAQQLEAEGRTIIHMEIGEPDFATPPAIVAAASAALAAGKTRYTAAAGLPALRQAIADDYRQREGVEMDPARIIITPGASAALLSALGAILNRDEEVILADPGYPCNRHFVRFIDGRARAVAVDATTQFQLTLDHLPSVWTAQSRAVLLATPSNPTGTAVGIAELARMAAWVKARQGWLIVDEIYHRLMLDETLPSAVTLGEDLIIVNSFSKYYCMTGWRLGWLVVPPRLQRSIEKLMQNLYIAAPTVAQHAALAAFLPETTAILEAQRDELRQRRDYLLAALADLGLVIPAPPAGGLYLYADVTPWGGESFSLATRLLEEAGVAVTPGRDFGANHCERYLRFAFTQPLPQLREGVERLRRWRATSR